MCMPTLLVAILYITYFTEHALLQCMLYSSCLSAHTLQYFILAVVHYLTSHCISNLHHHAELYYPSIYAMLYLILLFYCTSTINYAMLCCTILWYNIILWYAKYALSHKLCIHPIRLKTEVQRQNSLLQVNKQTRY